MPKRIIVDGISKYPPVEAVGKYARTGRETGKVIARNIPSQYARSTIQASAASQKFSEPQFAGLIRID